MEPAPPVEPPSNPPGLAFRDEIIPWLDDGTSSGEGDGEDEDEEIVDESAIHGDTLIETPITSGADPSDWNSIGIDNDD